jgi:hypothetical protein
MKRSCGIPWLGDETVTSRISLHSNTETWTNINAQVGFRILCLSVRMTLTPRSEVLLSVLFNYIFEYSGEGNGFEHFLHFTLKKLIKFKVTKTRKGYRQMPHYWNSTSLFEGNSSGPINFGTKTISDSYSTYVKEHILSRMKFPISKVTTAQCTSAGLRVG